MCAAVAGKALRSRVPPHLEMMAKDAVSTAALPSPLTMRDAMQATRKAVLERSSVTAPKAAADTAQTSCPASSSVFRRTSLEHALL